MAFDPNYASNGLFYVFFTEDGTTGAALGTSTSTSSTSALTQTSPTLPAGVRF